MDEKTNTDVPERSLNHLGEGNAPFNPEVTIPNMRLRREHGELLVGDIVLSRYELLEKLGSGAMGVVFKCRDQVSRVEYALKMVPPELARNANAMEDVLENFQLVHGLKHPNIASVDFLDRDEYGSYFLIMEYAPGITLAQWIKQKWRNGKPEIGEVAGIVKQIASALDYAHQKSILHRDIKSTNIMVAENGEVKVLDFGLASKVRNTLTAMSINPANTSGTPSYLAPEQFKGRYPTPAADQYALGVLAYQMLSGHLPFDSDDYTILRSAVVSEEPESIDGIPDATNQCLSRVLSKDPKARYASCTEFAGVLKNAVDGIDDAKIHKCDSEGNDSPDRKSSEPSEAEQIFQEGERLFEKGDLKSAVIKYHIAADKGSVEAWLELGGCYTHGWGVERNEEEAFKWYQKAAEQGNADACFIMLDNYSEGNEENVFKWYQKAAERGNAEAQCYLGDFYANGWGVEKNEEEAYKWFQRAAEQGDASAQWLLGDCYANGEGIEKNDEEAFNWYQKAAEQGDAQAKIELGQRCYENGKGIAKNDEEAFKWFQRAAEQGNVEAQFELGQCYASGRGVEQNEAEAVKCYQKAAEQHEDQAKNELVKRNIFVFKNVSFSLEEIYKMALFKKLHVIAILPMALLCLLIGSLFVSGCVIILVDIFTDKNVFSIPWMVEIGSFAFGIKSLLLGIPLYICIFFISIGEIYEKKILKKKGLKGDEDDVRRFDFPNGFYPYQLHSGFLNTLPWSEIKRLKNAIKEKNNKHF